MKKLLSIVLAFTALVLAGCGAAPANLKTIHTTDCGRTWSLVEVGETLPLTKGQVCSYIVQMPDYPMQGDTEFLTQFQDGVLVRVKISYDYQISDPLLYIKYAKFLGRMTDSNDSSGVNGGAYETAENMVIDVRLREMVTSSTPSHNIVTFNPSEYEANATKLAQAILEERGVAFNSMTFVVIPEEQTRTAIDSATAMAIYRANGMEDLGRNVITAKAGAARVVVNSTGDKH